MLQQIALKMHERQLKEVAAEELRGWLTALFWKSPKNPAPPSAPWIVSCR